MLAHAVLAVALTSPTPIPGLYTAAGARVYVGPEADPPNEPSVEYFDAKTRRFGSLKHVSGDTYATTEAPAVTYQLAQPVVTVREDAFTAADAGGMLGASLWYADTKAPAKRPTILLVHGAADESRDMGFMIPYFVAHGVNVVTYDQRGTGQSAGSWRYSGPESKADDAIAILQALRDDPRIERNRIGVWGPSNGGWVAPIVATRYPLAFIILKSPAAESIEENVLYEIHADLVERPRFSSDQVDAAMAFERAMFAAIAPDATPDWESVSKQLAQAKTQPWFSLMRIPPDLTLPPPPPVLAGFRASLIYDPTSTLERVKVPTLAIFGALDKNVDALDSASRLRKAFAIGGNDTLKIVTFANADHLIEASTTGYEATSLTPDRLVASYPEIMVDWLKSLDII
ncbi:MAG: alpha/beta hydrolase, partial [Candidatus Tumulicola sp.]